MTWPTSASTRRRCACSPAAGSCRPAPSAPAPRPHRSPAGPRRPVWPPAPATAAPPRSDAPSSCAATLRATTRGCATHAHARARARHATTATGQGVRAGEPQARRLPRHRLLALHRLRVVDRFRPLVPLGEGSAPYHYVLGEAGAIVLAAEMGVEVHLLGYRRDRALAIAHSPSLPRLLAANGFFA